MGANPESEHKEGQGGKGRWVTAEELTSLMPLKLNYIRHLYSKTCEKWRCASRIDERDLWRFSKSKVLIWYMPRNPASGEHYPRTVERPDDPPTLCRARSRKAGQAKRERADLQGNV